jgi:hypothetical protein
MDQSLPSTSAEPTDILNTNLQQLQVSLSLANALKRKSKNISFDKYY